MEETVPSIKLSETEAYVCGTDALDLCNLCPQADGLMLQGFTGRLSDHAACMALQLVAVVWAMDVKIGCGFALLTRL